MQGYRKPAKEAYTSAVEALGVPAADLVFIDDRQVNVDGALAAGFGGAILFKGAAELEQQLKARGLVF